MFDLKTLSLKSFVIIGIITIAAVWIAVVLPFNVIMPDYKTELVTIIQKTQDNCIVETKDGFLITISSCDGQTGEEVEVTYDVNKKEFSSWLTP